MSTKKHLAHKAFPCGCAGELTAWVIYPDQLQAMAFRLGNCARPNWPERDREMEGDRLLASIGLSAPKTEKKGKL